MHSTHNDLSSDTRQHVIATLTMLLTDAVDLYSQCKQAHWNVRGSGFISLHELFDRVATVASTSTDMIAERILQLGGEADGGVRAAAKHSRLKEYPLLRAAGDKHVEALSAAISAFTAHSRKGIAASAESGDDVTADMLTEITRNLDEQLWFVESHQV